MTRVAVALAVVIALVAGVWMLWPDGERPPTTTSTLALAAPSSSSTSTAPLSTTTTADDHVVDTVEEAEAILRELWFGWFEGIYNEDENRIREVVVRDSDIAEAIAQFGSGGFAAAPQPEDLHFEATEILRADKECLVVWTRMGTSGFADGESEVVSVIRRADGSWKSFSVWRYRNDLWEGDCDVSLS